MPEQDKPSWPASEPKWPSDDHDRSVGGDKSGAEPATSDSTEQAPVDAKSAGQAPYRSSATDSTKRATQGSQGNAHVEPGTSAPDDGSSDKSVTDAVVPGELPGGHSVFPVANIEYNSVAADNNVESSGVDTDTATNETTFDDKDSAEDSAVRGECDTEEPAGESGPTVASRADVAGSGDGDTDIGESRGRASGENPRGEPSDSARGEHAAPPAGLTDELRLPNPAEHADQASNRTEELRRPESSTVWVPKPQQHAAPGGQSGPTGPRAPWQRQPGPQTWQPRPAGQQGQAPGQQQPWQQRQGHGQHPWPGQGAQAQDRQPERWPQSQPLPNAGHAMPMRIPAHAEQQDSDSESTQALESSTQPTTGSEHGAREAEQKQRPKRKRPVLIGASSFVVIAIVVVLALPYVSNRLGLPWAPNAPKANPPEPVAVARALQGPNASAPAPTPDGVAGVLSSPTSSPALGTLTGSVIDPSTGTVLWDHDSAQALTPASTTKLLTASAALLALDHTARLSTKVVAGDEPGTVVLVGGGDPTLSSLPAGKDSIYPGAAHLDDLVAQVKQAVGGNVRSVRMDLSAYQGEKTAQGWSPEDAPSTYAASVEPAMLDGGRTSATDEKAQRTDNPAGVLATEFAKRLDANVGQPTSNAGGQGAKVLGEVKSAPLTELTDQLLTQSDNLVADVVARQVAKVRGEQLSFSGGAKATLDVLAENGFDTAGVKLSDGSGLSTLNKVPARLLSQLLSVAAGQDFNDPRVAKLRPLLGGLPVAGGSGTLEDRYAAPPAQQGKGWVRAKTGTLSGVNTEAGVVLDAEGRPLVFALMSNSQTDADTVRKALDDIAGTLRGCGCR